jgi:hypothetical protein
VHCHAGCNRDDIIAELRRRRLIASRSEDARLTGVAVRNDDRADIARRTALALRIWGAARDARASPVVHYLAGRGITIPMPLSLRWAPALRRPDRTYGPAMVARVDNLDGELIGVHRTWIERGPNGIWRRRDRASLGPIARGAVRLALADEMLLIGEGLETCLAAMQATGQPAWAALSTSGMTALQLPKMVRQVVILADNDCNGAGERAARAAAERWLAEGRRVRIATPPQPNWDFADLLIAGPRLIGGRDVAA